MVNEGKNHNTISHLLDEHHSSSLLLHLEGKEEMCHNICHKRDDIINMKCQYNIILNGAAMKTEQSYFVAEP
jgi:hypothetical protein